ncbi:hypothetical protein GCM10010975_21900 [Comamonas phosphati]|nr:hypothetical protein GCM10010975_21900 [Comamonas phosphati]
MLAAPAATPEPVVSHLHEVLAQILADPGMQQSLRDQGYTPAREAPSSASSSRPISTVMRP